MQMPDVNVLIYAHREEAPEHRQYSTLLSELIEGPNPVAISEVVLFGFVRVVTHPKAFNPPVDSRIAWEFVSEIIDHPNVRLCRPGLEHFAIFRRLCDQVQAKGKLVADAFHAAVAIEHGCEWLTADGDFSRFPKLRMKHPLKK